ncbi:hypothetical protein LVO79_04235 [Roseivivax marinus]|jgi:hypothetical protein|nr:hypothetical protein [Roseivivax marinus]UMA65679.1 hypothetical protein LVO79_04235 [Roseivivax marinus]SEL48758.1 hypothetical protein SAMN05444413_109193 [Roseivivax marinus]
MLSALLHGHAAAGLPAWAVLGGGAFLWIVKALIGVRLWRWVRTSRRVR